MDQPKILVAIRKRPLSKKEQSKGDTDIITCKNEQTVIVSEYKQKVDLTKYIEETVFNFDYAFNQESTNEQIYDDAIRPLVDSAFQGAKVTCFAYGQTGSGKTFTMNGSAKLGVVGLYELGAEDIFAYLADPRYQHLKAKLSFFEIYCGKLYDLLNKRQQLKIREDNKQNINIIGLEERDISDSRQFHEYMHYGSTQRITSQNSANSQSSRSHAILQVTLKQGKKVFGKISFIDLAGNQRGADHTDQKKQTRIDGAQINKSLLSLKECIRALDQGKGHTPFRGSKLTMVLKDSFVGFCRTFMIGNVSPSSASSENTLNTLRYADRVKQLRKPTENLSKQQLKARQMMLPRQNKNAIKIDINNDDDAQDIEAKRQQAQKNYGIRDQPPRQSSTDPNKKFEQQRNRQQSFSGSSSRPNLANNLKNSQQIVPNKGIKQPTPSTNVAKVNMANDKKAPITNVPARPNMPTRDNNSMVGNPNIVNNGSGLHRNNSMNVNQNNRFGERMDEQPPQRMNNNNNNPRWFNNNYTNPNGMNNNMNQNNMNMNPNNMNQNNNYRQENMNYGMNQGNDKLNQYRPNYQQQQQQQLQNYSSVNSGLNYQSNYNNYNQNYNYPNQGYQQNNYRQPQPQKLIIPDDWSGMVDFINNTNDPELRNRVQQKLHETLFNEENDLIAEHSNTLRSSLDVTKAEMSLISSLQTDRDAVTTRQYLGLMQDSIDEKISLLQMLKEKMVQFSYKLDVVEEIEQKQGGNGDDGGKMYEQDQLLLDDLH